MITGLFIIIGALWVDRDRISDILTGGQSVVPNELKSF